MTERIMNVCGLGLGSLKRRVTLKGLLNTIPIFAEGRIQEKEERARYTRADYEELKKRHAALHKKLFEEQQGRQSHVN